MFLCLCLSHPVPVVQAQKSAASPAQATYQKGVAALQRGDLATARAAFEEVVRAVPTSPEGHNSLGWVLFAQGHPDEAISEYRTAIKLKPAFSQARINLANALSRQGKMKKLLPKHAKQFMPLQIVRRRTKLWAAFLASRAI
jgi:Tfp pilus assembly protein PilF